MGGVSYLGGSLVDGGSYLLHRFLVDYDTDNHYHNGSGIKKVPQGCLAGLEKPR